MWYVAVAREEQMKLTNPNHIYTIPCHFHVTKQNISTSSQQQAHASLKMNFIRACRLDLPVIHKTQPRIASTNDLHV